MVQNLSYSANPFLLGDEAVNLPHPKFIQKTCGFVHTIKKNKMFVQTLNPLPRREQGAHIKPLYRLYFIYSIERKRIEEKHNSITKLEMYIATSRELNHKPKLIHE